MESQQVELPGKTVVVKERTHTGTTGDVRTRMFKVNNYDRTGADKVQGYFLANQAMGKGLVTIETQDIERFATDREIEMV